MNSRLTVAAHVLGIIAYLEREEGRGATSDELAESVGTNAVVIRRVLGQLKGAGIVDSRRGAGGGSVLARDPREITMRDVYEAVQDESCELIGRHANGVGEDCPVAPVIAEYLDELYVDAEEALKRTLARVTVDSMSREVLARVRARIGGAPTNCAGLGVSGSPETVAARQIA
jgi:Rrf2 family protein